MRCGMCTCLGHFLHNIIFNIYKMRNINYSHKYLLALDTMTKSFFRHFALISLGYQEIDELIYGIQYTRSCLVGAMLDDPDLVVGVDQLHKILDFRFLHIVVNGQFLAQRNGSILTMIWKKEKILRDSLIAFNAVVPTLVQEILMCFQSQQQQ
ncbi:hypothetical protein ACJX0J_023857 [Zea mays]